MENNKLTLADAFGQAAYIVGGHGSRKVKVLKEALEQVDGETFSDHYGNGSIIDEFQQEMADVLGKEAAVFSQAARWRSRLHFASGVTGQASSELRIIRCLTWRFMKKMD